MNKYRAVCVLYKYAKWANRSRAIYRRTHIESPCKCRMTMDSRRITHVVDAGNECQSTHTHYRHTRKIHKILNELPTGHSTHHTHDFTYVNTHTHTHLHIVHSESDTTMLESNIFYVKHSSFCVLSLKYAIWKCVSRTLALLQSSFPMPFPGGKSDVLQYLLARDQSMYVNEWCDGVRASLSINITERIFMWIGPRKARRKGQHSTVWALGVRANQVERLSLLYIGWNARPAMLMSTKYRILMMVCGKSLLE